MAAGSRVTIRADLQPAPKEPQPSGTVRFYSGGSRIGTGRLAPDGSGGVSAAVTFIARRGTQPIVAVYPGDASYTPATSNTLRVAATRDAPPAEAAGQPAQSNQWPIRDGSAVRVQRPRWCQRWHGLGVP